jgi:hypothetical protein
MGRQLAASTIQKIIYLATCITVTQVWKRWTKNTDSSSELPDISILVGDNTALTVWRTTTAWKCKLVSLLIAAIGEMISIIFLTSATFAREDRSEYTGVRVLYGNIVLGRFMSETWLGILSTIVTSLLSRAYKMLGFSICNVVQWLFRAAGPELLHLGLSSNHPSGDSYLQIVQTMLSVFVIICHFGAGVGFVVAIRLVRVDMDVPDVANKKSG